MTILSLRLASTTAFVLGIEQQITVLMGLIQVPVPALLSDIMEKLSDSTTRYTQSQTQRTSVLWKAKWAV